MVFTPVAPNTGPRIYLRINGEALVVHGVDDNQLDLLPGTLKDELETAGYHVDKRFQENTLFLTLLEGSCHDYLTKLNVLLGELTTEYETLYPGVEIVNITRENYNIGG